MKELYITKANLTKIDSSLLPSGLTSLTLHKCRVTVRWFQPAVEKGTLQELEVLDLEGSTRTENATVTDIAEFTRLKSLDLSGCYRVGEPGVKAFAEKLTALEKLRMDDSEVDDPCLHHIGRHLKGLKVISMKNCSRITDIGLGSFSSLKVHQMKISSENITMPALQNLISALAN